MIDATSSFKSDSNLRSAAVAVFARPPIAGQVKTRLAATLGDEAALQVYRQLLLKTVQQVAASGYPFILFAAAPSAELSELAAEYGGQFSVQQGSNLGEKMVRALAQLHQQYQRALLVGTDCPVLTATHLHQGFAELAHAAVVMGPAEDGGYWLLGSSDAALWQNPQLLDEVHFGGPKAREMTLSCLHCCGATSRMLPLLWDVDTAIDYQRALAQGLLAR